MLSKKITMLKKKKKRNCSYQKKKILYAIKIVFISSVVRFKTPIHKAYATRAHRAAPTPLPSLANPILILFS